MFCTQCGKQIVPGARFCSACGAPVVGYTTGPVPVPAKESAHGPEQGQPKSPVIHVVPFGKPPEPVQDESQKEPEAVRDESQKEPETAQSEPEIRPDADEKDLPEAEHGEETVPETASCKTPSEEPQVGESRSEEPQTEEPKTKEPQTEEPQTEESPTEEPLKEVSQDSPEPNRPEGTFQFEMEPEAEDLFETKLPEPQPYVEQPVFRSYERVDQEEEYFENDELPYDEEPDEKVRKPKKEKRSKKPSRSKKRGKQKNKKNKKRAGIQAGPYGFYKTAKGTMQALYSISLLLSVICAMLWFIRIYPTQSGTVLSSFEYYRTALRLASAEYASLQTVRDLLLMILRGFEYYGSMALMIAGACLLLLPTLGLGARTKGMAVIPLFASLGLMVFEGLIALEYLKNYYSLSPAYIGEIPVLALVYLFLQLLAILFDLIIIVKGGRRKVAP